MNAPVVIRRSAALGLHGLGGTVRLRTSRCAYLGDAASLWAVVHDDALGLTPASIVLGSPGASGRVAGGAGAGRSAGALDDAAFLPLGAEVRMAWGRLRCAGSGGDLAVAAAPCWQQPELGRTPLAPASERAGVLASAAAAVGGLERSGALLDRLADVLHAVDTGRYGELGRALDRLVGFGPGLTPAGDDALVGLLAVVARWPEVLGPPGSASRLRAATADRLTRTTEYGGFYLGHALDGRFGQALLAVRDGLALGERTPPEVFDAALGALLAVGATSGADLLVGLLAGFARIAVEPEGDGDCVDGSPSGPGSAARRTLVGGGVPA